ncbi:MAG: DNA-directed RNA polymerase subunit H [Candidatus Woesearchaeota archaeon]
MAAAKFDVTKHVLVPKHSIVSEKEKNALFDRYNVTIKELPTIKHDDPAIRHLKAKAGDIIKIIRKSPTAGETVYFRGVINA